MQKHASPATPAASGASDLAARSAFWTLPDPALGPEEARLVRSTALALNWGGFGLELAELDVGLMVSRLAPLGAALGPERSALRFMALARIPMVSHRRQPYCHKGAAGLYRFAASPGDFHVDSPKEEYFELDKPTTHLGLALLLAKKSQLTRALLKAGCHPALMFAARADGSDIPTPEAFCERLVEASLRSSEQPCAALFASALGACSDPKLLVAAMEARGRALLAEIWTSRPGIANQAEMAAARKARFAFSLLSRRAALPDDLAEPAASIATKLGAAGDEEPAKLWESGPELSARMRGLVELARGDDALGFSALAPLCGALDQAFFDAGVPRGLEIGYRRDNPERYWTTRLAEAGAWRCAARMLELGDNAWLCSGDGEGPIAAEANPFTRLATWGGECRGAGHFPAFALAWARAALRDAESREPGSGRARCLAAFDESRSRFPSLWSADASAPALAACESALLSLDSDAQAPRAPEADSAPRARKSRL